MKRFATVVVLLVFCLALTASANQIIKVDRTYTGSSFLGYAPDRIIVVMKPEAAKLNARMSASGTVMIGDAAFDAISERYAVSNIKMQFPGSDKSASPKMQELSRYQKVFFNDGTLEEVVAAYSANPLVDHVEPVGIHAMWAVPNDNYYSPYQWYHEQTSDDDIDSETGWDIQTGSTAVIVADLDSGCRYYHPDLGGVNASPTNPGAARGNMWINNAELNGTPGVDDDGNGYVDDWIGYDFIESTTLCWNGEDCNTKDNDPRDFNGHGTHTAGIVAMLTNDGYGMAGVAGGWGNGSQAEYGNGVKLMALRMGYSYNYLGQEYGVVLMDAAAEAFYYAANNGARIATCSWGSSNSGGIAAAADYFIASGGLIFTAAGNDGTQTPSYLGSRSDVIAVAATDENDNAASFTTYGTWVDISAPGNNIYSTYHDHTDPNTNYWASLSGTSMACPMAAATAAMIWSQNPGWTAAQVEAQLYASAENIDAELSATYLGKMGAGRINLHDAVNTGPVCDVTADFSASTTSGCAPLNVNFTDLSTGTGIDSWSWDFGDGGNSTAQNPSHSYTAAGTYTVSLTANSSSQSCGDTKTVTGYITVSGGPTADFSGSPTSGTEPLTVNFTDQSTDATGWSWDFGDGGSSTAQNPSHQYASAGTYTVALTATNACGSDVATKTNYITVNPCVSPVADFSGSPTSGDAPLNVSFTDLSTGGPSSWSWDFGDGGNSTAQNPSHSYASAGTYTVSMTATNACGSDIATKTNYITVNPPPATQKYYATSDLPVAGTVSGSYLNTLASDNSRESITERQSGGKPSSRYSYLEHKWTFSLAGGATAVFYVEGYRTDNAQGDDFTFAYSTNDITYTPLVTIASSTEGIYSANMPGGLSGTVYIRVTDTDQTPGNNSEQTVYVDEMYIEAGTPTEPPVADFSATPTSGYTPLDVQFTDLSTNGPSSWSWDFGDGNGSTAQSPLHTYTSAGIYTVSLTATNSFGSDTQTKVGYITVTDPPASSTMHVQSMTVGRAKIGAYYHGTCTVTIFSDAGLPVSNATVFVTASGPTGGSYSGATAADGTVSFQTATGEKKPAGEWCFEVTNVTHGSLTYASADNNATYTCESGVVFSNGDPALLAMPQEFSLTQNYPNPFNPTTEISFVLPEAAFVKLDIFNIRGQRVAQLLSQQLSSGEHTVTWDATKYSSGVYLYRLQAGEIVATRKMTLLK